jgi:cyclohexyl-isocyanide hydratase
LHPKSARTELRSCDMDIGLFLQSIGLSGREEELRAADLKSLNTLTSAIVQHIIYQNTDLHISKIDRNYEPLPLDITSLQEKLLVQRRGGMCYEISELYYNALDILGFDVRRVSSKALNNLPYNPNMPLTHNVLLVSIAGRQFLMDVAFSYNSIRFPLEIYRGEAEHVYDFAELNERYKLIQRPDEWELHVWLADKNDWFSLHLMPNHEDTVSSSRLAELHEIMMKHELPVAIRQSVIKIGALNERGRVGFHFDLPTLTGFFIRVVDGITVHKKLYDYKGGPGSVEIAVRDVALELPTLHPTTLRNLRYVLHNAAAEKARLEHKPCAPAPDAAIHVGFILFPNLTQLDLTGPYEVFITAPRVVVHLIWKTIIPIHVSGGSMRLLPDTSFEECPALDILCVPGGPGVNALLEDSETLDFIREKARAARYVTSVCTGALALGAAGLLRGRRATTHWASMELLGRLGAIPVDGSRVVRDGHIVTGGGVTAGIDFALFILAELMGKEAAEEVQLRLEYDPQPPFQAGHPKHAPDGVLIAARDKMANNLAERNRMIAKILTSNS